MSIDPANAKREAEIRAKLPNDVVALIDAARLDPGALLEPDALKRLRELRAGDPATWARARAMVRPIDGVSVTDLDRMTKPAGGEGDGLQGRAVEWDDPVPCSEAVDGAALLDDIKGKIAHYASLPAGGAAAVSLWALYTWVFDAFGVSPNLMMTAPERESGKTRVMELLSWMVRRAKPVSDASAAAIIRGIERDAPTLLFDEAQSFLKRKGDDLIRGVLLASFARRFAIVERVEGDGNENRVFSTFTPKAMNGRKLATIDDMLTSRSIVIAMTRAPWRMPDLRADRDPVGEAVRARCARWAADHAAALREADPDMGARFGRSADVWRPLFAIADEAGGDWPALARSAADILETSASKVTGGGTTLGVMLLADIREVFGDREHIQSEELDRALNALTERPWATLRPGDKPMTPQARGRLVATYGIETVEVSGRRKGYRREQFEEAWAVYLSDDTGESNRGTVETLQNKGFCKNANRGNGAAPHGSGDAGNPTNEGTSTVPRFNIPGNGGGGVSAPPARVEMPKQRPGTERGGEAYRRTPDGE